MKPEPRMDRQVLREAIQQAYDITVSRLEFVPTGFVTNSYRVTGTSGGSTLPKTYFLKVWNQSRWGKISAGRLDFTLALTGRLEQLGFNVPRAIPAQSGERIILIGDLTLVMYEYLDGHTLSEEELFAPGTLQELAGAVARLHKSTAAIDLPIPDVEQYKPPFLETMLVELDKLAALPQPARRGQEQLRGLLLPEAARIRTLTERMLSLAARTQAMHPEWVLCHTDLHGLNMIQTVDGMLYLLDWEGAMLAPPEHDLFIFCGDAFPRFLEAYQAESGPVELSADAFGYYFYRRSLEDLTDFLVTILEENTEDGQDETDLEGVREIVAGWPDLEARIIQVKHQLAPLP